MVWLYTGKVTITLAVRVASSATIATTTTAASSSSLASITAASTSAVDAGNTSNSSSAVRPLASTDGTPLVPPVVIKAAAAPTVADSQSIQGLGLGPPLETVKPMNNNNNSSSSATTDDDGKAADEYFDNYEEEEGDFDQVTHRPTAFSSSADTHVSLGVTDDSPIPPYFVVHPNHPPSFPLFLRQANPFLFSRQVSMLSDNFDIENEGDENEGTANTSNFTQSYPFLLPSDGPILTLFRTLTRILISSIALFIFDLGGTIVIIVLRR